jgi:phage terminase small subunit
MEKTTTKPIAAKPSIKKGKAAVSVSSDKQKATPGKQNASKKGQTASSQEGSKSRVKSKAPTGQISKPKKKINCLLPGAELLGQGKSVKEVMEALEKEKASDLSVDEERFCQEFVSCNIAVRAALRVWPSYSYDYASTKAERLMKKDEIKLRIQQITEEHKERYGLTDPKVLKRLAAIALFDRRTLHKEDGSLKQIHELTEEEAAAITEIESVELFDGRGEDRHAIGLVRKVKFADPKGAIELAGKHLKLWKEAGSDGNPIVVVNRIELVPLQ